MKWTKPAFYALPHNIKEIFRGKNLAWIIFSFALTYVLVASGFDWWYFRLTRVTALFWSLFPADAIGFIVPIVLPLVLIFSGRKKRNSSEVNAGYAVAQAGVLAWVISSIFKAITGRIPPDFSSKVSTFDISHMFHFGFFQEGIYSGWPSSHAAVAFAIAITLVVLYPKRPRIRISAVMYALYVGVGVSATIHWFSESVTGAIVGVVIGLVVGRAFHARQIAIKKRKKLLNKTKMQKSLNNA